MRALYLAPPPRAVPFSAVLVQLFGGTLNSSGWALFGFSMIFVWIFADPADLRFLRGPLETTQGRLVSCSATPASVDDRPVFRHEFVYQDRDGATRSGRSFATGSCAALGPVALEHPAGRPDRARIKGLRAGLFPLSTLLILILPAAGLAMIVRGARSGLKNAGLLSRGALAAGTIVSTNPTGALINGRPVYVLTLAFADGGGRKRNATVRTHRVDLLSDEHSEGLLYDPADPEVAAAVDLLPGGLSADSTGSIAPASPALLAAALALPLLCLLGHGSYLYFVR